MMINDGAIGPTRHTMPSSIHTLTECNYQYPSSLAPETSNYVTNCTKVKFDLKNIPIEK